MPTTTEKLEDPNLNEEDKDAIVGAFVRHQENERLRKHWEGLLKEKHRVARPAAALRSATIRKIILAIMAVAATLLLLFLFLPGMLAEDGEQLLAANLTEITIEGARSGSVTTLDSLRRQIRKSYLAGDFSDAAATGEQLLSRTDASPEDQINLGVAYLRAGDYAAANKHFSTLIDQAGNFSTEARFFLGLSLLSSGDTEAGLVELRQIQEKDGLKLYKKAQALIGARW